MAGAVARNFTLALAGALDGLLNIYSLVLLVAIIASWVNADPYNPIVRFLRAATEPLLYRVRRALPFVVVGSFDLSPIIVFLGIQFLRTFLVGTLADFAYRLALAGPVALVPVGENRGVTTWDDGGGVTVALRDGLLVQTHGLAEDLVFAERPDAMH